MRSISFFKILWSLMLAAALLSGCGDAETAAPTQTPLPASPTPAPPTLAPTATTAITPTQAIPPTWSPAQPVEVTPTLSPPPTETIVSTPTKVKKPATIAIGPVTDLGSGSDKSTVSVYITGGRIMVYATGFTRDVTLFVKVREEAGGWNALQKIHILKDKSASYGTDLPSQYFGITPLQICLKSMRSNDQNCYSVANVQ